MTIYTLGIEDPDSCVDCAFEFIADDTSGHPAINYHKTVQQIESRIQEGANTIAVPFACNLGNYGAHILLDFIRLSTDERIARAGLMVVGDFSNTPRELEFHCNNKVELRDSINPQALPKRLLSTQWEDVVRKLALEPPESQNHDVANRWGPYRLSRALDVIQGSTAGSTESLKNPLVGNVSRYYRRLICQENQSIPNEKLAKQSKKTFERLKNQLGALIQQNKELKILIIEDELEQGWETVYRELFKALHPEIKLTFCNSPIQAEEHLLNLKSFALVLMDLRLDKDKDHDTTFAWDLSQVSGIRLLKKLKKHDFMVPVIMTTASNKSWSLEAVLDTGADAFWTKESPDTGPDIKAAIKNSGELLQKMHKTLEWANQVRPLIYEFEKVIEAFCDHPKWKQHASDNQIKLNDSLIYKLSTFKGLLRQPDSEAVKKLNGESQWRMAFLVAWSIVNDYKDMLSIERVKDIELLQTKIDKLPDPLKQKLDTMLCRIRDRRNYHPIIHGRALTSGTYFAEDSKEEARRNITGTLEMFQEILKKES